MESVVYFGWWIIVNEHLMNHEYDASQCSFIYQIDCVLYLNILESRHGLVGLLLILNVFIANFCNILFFAFLTFLLLNVL